MERLSLPRRNYQGIERAKSPQQCRPELPKDPLPTWVTLPMDSKLPMIPGPKKNIMLYTTNLCEKMHMSSPELDFDLSDPYALTMSNCYKPLHDPHLRPHLDMPYMRKRLYRGGFITKDGKVLCTLKEYNEYRQYLRKIYMLLERGIGSEILSPEKRRVGQDGDKKSKEREVKVKSMREKIEKQYQEEKERYMRLFAENEERCKSLQEARISRMTERERQLKEEYDKRQALVERKQEEDRERKMEMLHRWMKEDKERCDLAEKRKAQRVKQREITLAQSWDERRKLQAQRLEEEQRIRRNAELIKQRRMKERQQMITRQRRRQQAIYERMIRHRREERERIEAEYAKNIAMRQENRKKRLDKMKKKGKTKKPEHKLKSNWNTTQLLLEEFSGSEDIIIPPKRISDSKAAQREQTTGKDSKEKDQMLSPEGIPTSARITKGLVELLQKNCSPDHPPGPLDIASALVYTNNYLAAEVFYPALKRYCELKSGSKKSLRFSMNVAEMYYDSYQPEYDDFELANEKGYISEEDSDEDQDSNSRLLVAVDSLTKLRASSESSLAGLSDILCRILEQLENGQLSQEKAMKLSAVAKEILLESMAGAGEGAPSSNVSDTSLVSLSSTTSIIASKLVDISMQKVQGELFKHFSEDFLDDYYEWPPCRATSSELAGMSKFVVETAIVMAVESLLNCTDDIIGIQKTCASDSQLYKSRKGKGGTASESNLERPDSTSPNITSQFILNLLTKVVDQVREEEDLYTPKTLPPKRSGDPQSDTSVYIMNVLKKVVSEVQGEFAEQLPELQKNEASSQTSVYIMNTLDKVIKEIQKSRGPSATTSYIDSLLDTAKEGSTTLSKNKSSDLSTVKDRTSITSMFIRTTLSKVLKELEDEFEKTSTDVPSISSLIAQEIVNSTMKKCDSAVNQGMINDPKMTELVAAIITSHQKLEECRSNPEIPFSNQPLVKAGSYASLKSVSSSQVIAENFIRTTLEAAKDSLAAGFIQSKDVLEKLSSFTDNTGRAPSNIPHPSCSKQEADAFVNDHIDRTLLELETEAVNRNGNLTEGPDVSQTINQTAIASLVQSILNKAVKELNMGLVDDSAIEKMETDIRKSIEDTSVDPLSNEVFSQSLLKDYSDVDIIVHEYVDESEDDDTLDDLAIRPVYQGEDVDVDPETMCKALMAISVKRLEEMDDLKQAIPRNSFRSLFRPDITDVENVDTSSTSSVKSDLVKASKGTLPSQTRLRTKSMLIQGKKLSEAEDSTFSKKTLKKSQSLQMRAAEKDDNGSSTSPFGSPGASPKASTTKAGRASIARESAPSLSRKKSPTKTPSSNFKPASPKSSKQSISSYSPSKSSLKGDKMPSSPVKKKSSETRPSPSPPVPRKGSSKSVRFSKKRSGELSAKGSKEKVESAKKKGNNDEEKEVVISNTQNVKSTESIEQNATDVAIVENKADDTKKLDHESTTENEEKAESRTQENTDKGENQVDEEPETPPEEIQVSKKNSKTKKDKPLPRESGPIEMVSSNTPPSAKKSSETNISPSKSEGTSPNSHKSINLAPRPSSGFKMSSNTSNSSLSQKRRGSQESMNDVELKKGSTHSMTPVKENNSGGVPSKKQVSKSKIN